ncbi:hypothetical protein REPUB_Repub14bG0130900 [Reevesia pubescens]
MVAVIGGNRIFVSFRYEILPDFCYVCGRMDHLENEYGIAIKCKKDGKVIQRVYGAWLRAETTRIKSSTYNGERSATSGSDGDNVSDFLKRNLRKTVTTNLDKQIAEIDTLLKDDIKGMLDSVLNTDSSAFKGETHVVLDAGVINMVQEEHTDHMVLLDKQSDAGKHIAHDKQDPVKEPIVFKRINSGKSKQRPGPYSKANFKRPLCTWSHGRGENFKMIRLDRGLATAEWFNMFPEVIE